MNSGLLVVMRWTMISKATSCIAGVGNGTGWQEQERRAPRYYLLDEGL